MAMSQRLILTDGTELEGHILDNGDEKTIFVYLTGGISMQTGINLFADAGKIRTIREISYGHERIYQGYTVMENATNEFGNCNLVMVRGDS